jgi:hypothetical protein
MLDLRRKVLSAVDVFPVPQAVPGLDPICPKTSTRDVPFLRARASLPLKVKLPLVCWAVIAAEADECLMTNVDPAATVPTREIVALGVSPHMKLRKTFSDMEPFLRHHRTEFQRLEREER